MFRQMIEDSGHTIVPLSSFDAASLSGLDGLILANGYDQNTSVYTATERSDIQAFTADRAIFLSDRSLWKDDDTSTMTPISFEDNGRLLQNSIDFISRGGTIFAADAGSGSDIDNFNEMVSFWGVEYARNATEGDSHTISNFLINPVTDELDLVGVDFQQRIVSFGIATDVTIGDGPDDFLAVLPAPSTALTFVFASMLTARRHRRQDASVSV